jgi:cytochrome c556
MKVLATKALVLTLSAAALAAGALLATPRTVSGAADEPAVKPVATIKDVMFTFNEGPTSVVGHAREGFNAATCDDEAWEILQARTTMLMEAGNMLLAMKPPMGADDAAGLAKWKAHVVDYRNNAEEARAAATKKDLAAGKAALAAIAKRCSECHKDHRKDD